jgi:response regulator of citrate/malate metabolism
MTKEFLLLQLLNEILVRVNKIEEQQVLHSQLFQELQANSVPKSKISKNKQTKGAKRVNVNIQVIALFLKNSNKVWTSNELAKKIGCSNSAVKKTSAWKNYQKTKASKQCSIRKGSKDQNGNINVAVTEDNEIDDEFDG